MKKHSRYLLRVRLGKREAATRCDFCDFSKLCIGFRFFNPYISGIPGDIANQIIKRNMHFKVSKTYEDVSEVYAKNRIGEDKIAGNMLCTLSPRVTL